MGTKIKQTTWLTQAIKYELFWYSKNGLEKRGYHQSQFTVCVLKKDSVIITYVDDCVIVSHKKLTIKSFIESINIGPEDYVLTDEGDISIFIWVNIDKKFI